MRYIPSAWLLKRPNLFHGRLLRCARWRYEQYQQRCFGVEAIAAVLVPPAVFSGLLVSLWAYKCIMMVIFQNKIIYMPSVPPFSRSEKVSDYISQCRPIQWTEHTVRSGDGTRLKLLDGSVSSTEPWKKEIVVVYFQGNASSLPPRLPYLSKVLSAVQRSNNKETQEKTLYRIVALSYRGFWTSSGRPSQAGIELDAETAIRWVLKKSQSGTKVILWGQSIGAGAASVSLSNVFNKAPGDASRIAGLILETPFVDLRTMLVALYPQKFLPYRYLGPFLMSTWDSKTALTCIGDAKTKLRVFILQAGDDELVAKDNAQILEQICLEKGLEVQRVSVPGALHTEVMMKGQGRSRIVSFIESFNDSKR